MRIGYVRVSTEAQDVTNQKFEILEYARRTGTSIDDFIEVEISSRKSQEARRLDELLSRLSEGDTIITAELSRLGRSTAEVISLIHEIIRRRLGLVAIKQNLVIPADGAAMDMGTKVTVTVFSLLAELERDLISQRTKQALAAKKAGGVTLGKPRGTLQASKLDDRREDIVRLLEAKVPVAAIARLCQTTRNNVTSYIRTRGLAPAAP